MDTHSRAHKPVVVGIHPHKTDSSHKKRTQPKPTPTHEARKLPSAQPTAVWRAGESSIPTFQYFASKIQFKGEYRSELWPRQKIVNTFRHLIHRDTLWNSLWTSCFPH